MPNLDFAINRSSGYDDGLTVGAKLRGIDAEFRGSIQKMIEESLAEGYRVARAEAPRGPVLERNVGRRIVDQILVTPVRFHPGGAGGGGFWEGDLHAGEPIIGGHLGFVFEGTAGGGVGKIFPTRGKVLALQKEGEGVKFRRWVHGQKPQQRWWLDAQDAMERRLEEQVHTARFIHGLE